MKRSRVHDILREGDAVIQSLGYEMPRFAYLSPSNLRLIARRGKGWDVEDHEPGTSDPLGLFMFTLCSGQAADMTAGHGRLRAEKS